MTLNPSAAHGLEACTPAQAHEELDGEEKFSEAFGVECPAASKIATVSLNVPTLPNGSLTGSAYLGAPEVGTDHGPAVHDVRGRELRQVRRLGATRRTRDPERNHWSGHDCVQHPARTAVQQPRAAV